MNELIGIIIAVMAGLAGAWFAGRSAEKSKQDKRSLDAMRKAKDISREIQTKSDDDLADMFDRLHNKRR